MGKAEGFDKGDTVVFNKDRKTEEGHVIKSGTRGKITGIAGFFFRNIGVMIDGKQHIVVGNDHMKKV